MTSLVMLLSFELQFLNLDCSKSVGELQFFPLVCSAISHVHVLLNAGEVKFQLYV